MRLVGVVKCGWCGVGRGGGRGSGGGPGRDDWVGQPLVEVTGRFAEGIVMSGYGPVEPCAVWVARGHVVLVWAVEAVVCCVSTPG